jgi:hypothetical protein
MRCTPCELRLHHCHGLVALHDDGSFTCLDGCGDPLAVHDEVVACGELDLGCCTPLVPAAPAHEPAWAA